MHADTAPSLDLLLVGGGHAHALVLRKLAMVAPTTLRITLISPSAFTPYSGMLPGLLAGHYAFEDAHIDLARLCQWAGVRFLADTVTAIDPERQVVHCRQRGELGYDLVSLDIGSQPELDSVPGARQYAVPVKPVAGLWQRWQGIAANAGQRLAIVGGGAGSVEIALAVAHRLAGQGVELALYCGGPTVLGAYAPATRRSVKRYLRQHSVSVHCDHRVSQVEADRLQFQAAPAAEFDTLIWCTGAAAAPWLAQSTLPTDERGFMLVEDTLQSIAYPNVFGAGDVATQHRHPRPKAGVYAVRQAPVLGGNLLAFARGDALLEHRPQKRFLSLLSLGPKVAVAERNGLSVQGAVIWNWKDSIDRKFMRQFTDTAELMPALRPTPEGARLQVPCGGCGAKVAAHTLRDVLVDLRAEFPDQAPQPAALDDAVCIDAAAPIMQSLDALRALVDDPWRMGRIAAQHALSDLYASGAQAHSALALVTLPFASADLLRRDLYMTLRGALSIFREAGCRLLGGHSMQGSEFQLGFAVNGTLGGQSFMPGKGAQPGDRLLLTKALGSGALFAAHMQNRADGRDIERALTAMEQSNAHAALVARRCAARALTDVTGFGLAGHLLGMLDERQSARVSAAALPILSGSLEAIGQGIFSTMHSANREAYGPLCSVPAGAGELVFDPQTSGGLLMSLPADTAQRALAELGEAGCIAAIIGEVITLGAAEARLEVY